MRKIRTQSRKQSFLEGALILMLANILIKLIGAIFKIPLKNLIGGDGMGIYNTAYTPYAFLLTIATAGIPVAVSRMVAEANALGRTSEIKRIFRVSLITSAVVGAALSVLMFAFAKPFVESIPNTRALYSVMMFAPALFFGAVVSAYRGYYQGMSNMVPTAISQVIEAVSRLIFGYAFALIAIRLGYSVEIAAAATILGVVVSTAAGMAYMLIREAITRTIQKLPPTNAKPTREIGRQLRNIAIPITIASGIMSMTNFIDMYVIQNRLQTIGYTEQGASTLYGIYETMCVSMMNLPQTLIAAVTVSLIPMIAASVAQANEHRARRTVESSLRLVSLMAFPCAVGLFSLTEPILSLLFREDVAVAAPLLKTLTLGTVFISFVSITNAILQAMGRERVALYSMLVGSVIKLAVNYYLIGLPSVGIAGAPIGTVLCYAVIMVINFVIIIRSPQVAPRKWGSILKPALAAAVMGVFLFLLYPWLSSAIGAALATIGIICAGAVIYVITLIAVRGFYREDIVMLPKGEKIANTLKLPKEN